MKIPMDHKEHITETTKKILSLMGISLAEVQHETDEKTGSLRIIVVTPESSLLIGEHGARLLALNHLLKRMMEKSFPTDLPPFFVDVNDYQKKRVDDIRAKAHMLAERARYFKSTVEMDPMSSYERMIVHSEFADTKDIQTESFGVGKERRVIIKYTENKENEKTA